MLLMLPKFLEKPLKSGFPALHVDCYSVVITSLTSGEVVESTRPGDIAWVARGGNQNLENPTDNEDLRRV